MSYLRPLVLFLILAGVSGMNAPFPAGSDTVGPDLLLVANKSANTRDNTVTVIDLGSLMVETTLRAGSTPDGMAYATGG